MSRQTNRERQSTKNKPALIWLVVVEIVQSLYPAVLKVNTQKEKLIRLFARLDDMKLTSEKIFQKSDCITLR